MSKKSYLLILLATLIFIIFPMGIAAASDEPVVINDAVGLAAISNNLNGNYVLGCNIDLSDYSDWQPIGDLEHPFTGSFDGKGFNISNMTVHYNQKGVYGLFGCATGTIKNVTLSDVTMDMIFDLDKNTIHVGALVAVYSPSSNCGLSDCHVKGDIKIYSPNQQYLYVGSLIGKMDGKNVSDTYITDCTAIADISAEIYYSSKSGYNYISGLAGLINTDSTKITNCWYDGDIEIYLSSSCRYENGYISGLFTLNTSNASANMTEKCYSSGNISVKRPYYCYTNDEETIFCDEISPLVLFLNKTPFSETTDSQYILNNCWSSMNINTSNLADTAGIMDNKIYGLMFAKDSVYCGNIEAYNLSNYIGCFYCGSCNIDSIVNIYESSWVDLQKTDIIPFLNSNDCTNSGKIEAIASHYTKKSVDYSLYLVLFKNSKNCTNYADINESTANSKCTFEWDTTSYYAISATSYNQEPAFIEAALKYNHNVNGGNISVHSEEGLVIVAGALKTGDGNYGKISGSYKSHEGKITGNNTLTKIICMCNQKCDDPLCSYYLGQIFDLDHTDYTFDCYNCNIESYLEYIFIPDSSPMALPELKEGESAAILSYEDGSPVAGASFEIENQMYYSNSVGLVYTENLKGIYDLVIVDNQPMEYEVKDVVLAPGEITRITIDRFSLTADDFNFGTDFSDTIAGPAIEIEGINYQLFDIPLKYVAPKFKTCSVAFDKKSSTYKVILGTMDDSSFGMGPGDIRYDKTGKVLRMFTRVAKVVDDFQSKELDELFDTIKDPVEGGFGVECKYDAIGYAEIAKVNGRYIVIEGQVVFRIDGSFYYVQPLGHFAFSKTTLEAFADVSASLNTNTNNKIDVTGDISLSPRIRTVLGLGFPNLAEIEGGVQGTLTSNIHIPYEDNASKTNITFTGEYYMKFKFLSLEKELTEKFYNKQLYPKITKPSEEVKFSYGAKSLGIASSLDYSENEILDNSIYSSSKVRLVNFSNGNKLMVYTDDDTNRNKTNMSALYYRINNGSGWSEPALVDDNGTGDFDFSVSVYENTAHIIWQDYKEVLSDTNEPDIETLKAAVNISTITISSDGTLGTKTTMDTETFPYLVRIKSLSDDSYSYSYCMGEVGDETIYLATSDNNIKASLTNLTAVVDSELVLDSDNNPYLVYMSDQDSDSGSYSDRNTYVLNSYMESTLIAKGNAGKLRVVDNNDICFTCNNGLYYCSKESYGKYCDLPENIHDCWVIKRTEDYYIVAIKTQESWGIGKINENGLFSYNQISDEGILSSLDTVITEDNSIMWAAIAKEEYSSDEALLLSDELDLNSKAVYIESVKTVLSEDNEPFVKVTYVTGESLYYGGVITFVFKNSGGNTIYTGKITYNDAVYANTVNEQLFKIPATDKNLTLELTFNNDLMDNYEFSLTGADLVVECSNKEKILEDEKVVVDIKNSGFEIAENVVIKITDEKNNLLCTEEVGDMDPYEYNRFEIADIDLISTKTLDISVSTDSTEDNTFNNSVRVNITTPKLRRIVVDDEISIYGTNPVSLGYSLYPYNSDASLLFASSNPDIVTINRQGVITPVSVGTADINIYSDNGIFAKTTVNVYPNSSIIINATNTDNTYSGSVGGITDNQVLKLIYAGYDSNGKMLSLDIADLTSNNYNFSVTVNNKAVIKKIFLMDNITNMPVTYINQ